MSHLRLLSIIAVIGCGSARPPAQQPPPARASAPAPASTRAPAPRPATAAAETPRPAACDAHQLRIRHDADARAAPWNLEQHLMRNFPDRKLAWLMKDESYQSFIVKPAAKTWGRCDTTGCYVFTAPAAAIRRIIEQSMVNGHHDPAALGKALGRPAASFEGPLRMMTFDLATSPSCARLPVETDPGARMCNAPDDTECFKFGGYTSGGIAELVLINAPVARTTIEVVP